MSRVCPVCELEYPDDVEVCSSDGSRLMHTPQAEEPPDPLLCQVVDGRYRVDELLGVGGMGAVYRAVQLTMNRPVALKVLRPELASDAEVVQRFLREVQAVSMLTHANTITVYDFGQSPEGLLYIAMEFLQGRALSEVIWAEGSLAIYRALRVIGEVAGALAEAHAQGIVHRDLKPDNIMLAEIGGRSDQVKVLDFGVAKLTETQQQQTELTKAGFTVGTPDYMAPEQAQAKTHITHHADLYALGCILFECLATRPPFVDDAGISVLMAHCTAEVPALASARPGLQVPEEVERLVRWLLAKEPGDRPESAEVLQQHIEQLLRALAPDGVFATGESAIWEGAGPPASPALAPDTAPDVPASLHSAETPIGSPTPIEAAGAPAGRKPPVAALVVAAVALVAAAAVGAFLLLGRGEGSGAGAATASGPASPEGKHDTRRIWLRSSPADAAVVEGGVTIGRTPLRLDVDPERVRRLTLELAGYADHAIAIDPGQKGDQMVELRAAERTRSKKPTTRRKKRKRKSSKRRSSGGGLFDETLRSFPTKRWRPRQQRTSLRPSSSRHCTPLCSL